MLYDYILQHASATIAGIKAGSLFRVPNQLWNVESGITLSLLHTVHLQCIPVQKSRQSVLLYLYNPDLLNIILTRPENIFFMRQLGYPAHSDKHLPILLQKIRDGRTFPHEIGLFLGYPLQDVEGYIANKGQNSLYNKYWKVYHNVEQTMQKFDRYDTCKERCKKARKTGAAFEEILQLYQ